MAEVHPKMQENNKLKPTTFQDLKQIVFVLFLYIHQINQI